jgi:hypothetical protein
MSAKLFFIFLFVTSFFTSSSQTCIIALRLGNGIMIGADSRRTTFTNAINSEGKIVTVLTYDTVCKIQHIGKIFFSQAGMNSDEAYGTARKCATEFKRLRDISLCYIKKRKPELLNYLKLAQKNIVLYKSNFEHLKNFETLFYGIENGVPKIASVNIYLKNKVDQKLDMGDSLRIYKPNKSGRSDVIALGEHEVVDSLIRVGTIDKMGLLDGVVFALLRQANATPESVSQPFEIFTLNMKSEVIWNYNPLNCK